MAERAPNTGHLIGNDGCADSRSAYGYTLFHGTVRNGTGKGFYDFGIIN
jgi:hypothetical protein